MAPMAGFTNYAYRQIVRRLGGVGLPATEMVSARGFLGIEARSGRLPERLWGVAEEPRPLAVQIWDNDPETLAAVGQRLAREFRVSVVDINFGCPVRDVSAKAESGSYLLRYPDRVGEIVRRVAEACAPCRRRRRFAWDAAAMRSTPSTWPRPSRGRAGRPSPSTDARPPTVSAAAADWEQIARIKPHLARIPLIGNGDLATPQDVAAAMTRYGVDGVMIGRAALARPWLFRQAAAALAAAPIPPEPSLAEQKQLLLDHYGLVVEQFGLEKGTILMRKLAACYAQGRRGARAFRKAIARDDDARRVRRRGRGVPSRKDEG